MFTLADGRVVADEEMGAELTGSISGPIIAPIDITVAKVAGTVEPGAEFQFTFDLGDTWIHRCVVGEVKIDPLEVLGVRPDTPLPYWGWGSIPDQYGRRWATDDSDTRAPAKPSRPHPMLLRAWPAELPVPTLDLTELRQAIAAGDASRFLAAVMGTDIDDALQHVGAGIPMALKHRRREAEAVAISIINRLSRRGGDGDRVLAEDLLAHLRGLPLTGRVVPVDLDTLSSVLEGDPALSTGGYLDLRTGEVYDDSSTDPMMVGEGSALDVEEEPDRWLRVDRAGSRNGWQDMATFAERQRDKTLRERLERAIAGNDAFFRFRDLLHGENLSEHWYVFSTDRQMGRARKFLADHGIRVA